MVVRLVGAVGATRPGEPKNRLQINLSEPGACRLVLGGIGRESKRQE
jgi:hypothetical protein